MKKLLLIMIFIPTVGMAQKKEKPLKPKEMLAQLEGKWELDDNDNVTFVKVIDSIDLAKEEIYNRALAYFTYNYVKGDWVVQVEDKEDGLIIGKGIYPDVHTDILILSPTSFDVIHLLRVDVKEGRVRIVVTLIGYNQTVYNYNAANSHYEHKISDTYPINEKAMHKKVYTKLFYKSYLTALSSFEKVENAIRSGNTSSEIENEDW